MASLQRPKSGGSTQHPNTAHKYTTNQICFCFVKRYAHKEIISSRQYLECACESSIQCVCICVHVYHCVCVCVCNGVCNSVWTGVLCVCVHALYLWVWCAPPHPVECYKSTTENVSGRDDDQTCWIESRGGRNIQEPLHNYVCDCVCVLLRLKVSVDDAQAMQMVQGKSQLSPVKLNILLCEHYLEGGDKQMVGPQRMLQKDIVQWHWKETGGKRLEECS